MHRFLVPMVCITLLALQGYSEQAHPGFDLYILRHAESMGNVTGDYSKKNQQTFSPLGLEQVAGVVEQLEGYEFDEILTSPPWRTQNTILPYLKAHDRVAEIWPEIEECCCGCDDWPELTDKIPFGDPIEMTDGLTDYFRLRTPDTDTRYAPRNCDQAMSHLQRGVDMLRERYGHSGKSVLLLNHSCSGTRIMEMLLGVQPRHRFRVQNASLIHLRQRADGQFDLLMLNEEPYTAQYDWTPDRVLEPGEALELTLSARHVAHPAGEYMIAWTLLDAYGGLAEGGESRIEISSREPADIASVTVDASKANYGETWQMESRLLKDGKEVASWEQDLHFPTYYDLSGTWSIMKGDDNTWAATDFDDDSWETTRVPGGWEKDAFPDYDGTAWYRATFTVSDTLLQRWGRKPLAIAFGAIDDADVTYLNGKKVGASGAFPPAKETAWDQPRIYEIDRELIQRENTIAVRVSDWIGGGGIWKAPAAIGPAEELRKEVSGNQ